MYASRTMKYFDWNMRKNEKLREERDISFEDVLIAIDEGKLLDIIVHPDQKQYQGQKIFIVTVNEYVYLVPFIEDNKKIFLKTIIPSRKATEHYNMTMKYYTLDKEEKEIIKAIERGSLGRRKNIKKEVALYRSYTRSSLNRTRNINIRLSERDLQKLKARAAEKGIPYQTLVASILHQYGTRA